MKRGLGYALGMAVLLAISLGTQVFAAEAKTMPMEQTITGVGMCAKCVLHEGTACQTVIQVKEGDKTVTYYLVDNAVSKNFHKNVCTSKEQVKAMGTVQEKDGKMLLTASKLELVKD